MDRHKLEKIRDGLNRTAGWIIDQADEIQAALDAPIEYPQPVPPPVVIPPPTPVPVPADLPWSWSLSGKPLPERPFAVLRAWDVQDYARKLDDEYETGGRYRDARSSCLTVRNSAHAEHFVCANSGGDAIKWLGGDCTLTDFHVYQLGRKTGAHADGIQSRGDVGRAIVKRGFFDMPANESGTRSNACIQTSNAYDGGGGDYEFEECIFRGGNYTLAIGDKKTGYALANMVLRRCTFVVEKDSPRYGLVQNKGGAFTAIDCEVVYYNRDTDLCELLWVGDPRNFDVKQWHVEKYGREPAH
ncbi:MAG: hypothetical protein GY716_15875 [bacterium]|nr:hypothetical protein [bacterium]